MVSHLITVVQERGQKRGSWVCSPFASTFCNLNVSGISHILDQTRSTGDKLLFSSKICIAQGQVSVPAIVDSVSPVKRQTVESLKLNY